MHVEAAGRLRNITLAHFVNALDMLPANPVGGHRIFRRGNLFARATGKRGKTSSASAGFDR